jgi:hypothetical protein
VAKVQIVPDMMGHLLASKRYGLKVARAAGISEGLPSSQKAHAIYDVGRHSYYHIGMVFNMAKARGYVVLNGVDFDIGVGYAQVPNPN